jgi:hypothetical protein
VTFAPQATKTSPFSGNRIGEGRADAINLTSGIAILGGYGMSRSGLKQFILVLGALSAPTIAAADQGGVSFWVPGFFGSLAAAPQQPGWSLTNMYYHTSVSAGADVAIARERTLGNIPANLNLSASLTANVSARGDLDFLILTYVPKTPVLGGQASFALLGAYGRVDTTLGAQLSGALSATTPGGIPLGSISFSRSDTINSLMWGFGDLVPQASLRWNNGAHNWMTYVTGAVPVGAYDPNRLSNTGIGHGAIDAGGGYTYFDPKTGHEFSGVLGFTYNFLNQATQYQNGVDMHFDWGTSQFVTKQFQAGLVGYVYKEVGCDSGFGDRVGCFQSQVVGIGPQIGFIFPVGDLQGYLNLKGYKEFAAQNRPDGWNTWVTFVISPAPPTSSTSSTPKRMITK